jgi:hypothetical protein
MRPFSKLSAGTIYLLTLDFHLAFPHYFVYPTDSPITELIRPIDQKGTLALVQYSRSDALDYISSSVNHILKRYIDQLPTKDDTCFQVALSPGGDGRVLAECVRRFWNERSDIAFHCIIIATGFESEHEHIANAVRIADHFQLPYTTFNVREAADKLGYTHDLNELSALYRAEFVNDSPEVMLTYWVQQLNFAIARETGRRAIIMGFNQEDVIAERLYQLMTDSVLPHFPIRRLGNFDIIAPLHQIPKRMLDAMDTANSIRNYNIRLPPVSSLRSCLYIVSHVIVEQFPAIADMISSGSLRSEDVDKIALWLNGK